MQDDLPTEADALDRERKVRQDNARELRDREVTPRLVHLADMHDLRVAQGDPDIRGWRVRTADGEKIGVVTDLVVDTQLMNVRYVEVRIDRETLNASADRHVLIPISSARLDDSTDDVFLNAEIVDPRTLAPYDRSMLTGEAAGLASSGTEVHATQEQFFGQRRPGRETASYFTPLNDAPRSPNQLP